MSQSDEKPGNQPGSAAASRSGKQNVQILTPASASSPVAPPSRSRVEDHPTTPALTTLRQAQAEALVLVGELVTELAKQPPIVRAFVEGHPLLHRVHAWAKRLVAAQRHAELVDDGARPKGLEDETIERCEWCGQLHAIGLDWLQQHPARRRS